MPGFPVLLHLLELVQTCLLSWWCHPTVCCSFAREAHKLRENFRLLDPQFITERYNLGEARGKRYTGQSMGSHSTSISMCSPAGKLPEPLPSEFEWRLHYLDVTDEIIDYWWLNSISSASPLLGMMGGGEVGLFSSKPLITGLVPLAISPHPNQFSSVKSFSHVWLFAIPWTTACQASLSITNSQSPPKPSPLGQWCHPTISSSVVPFSSCPQSFPASGSFPTSQLFTSSGQSIGVLASTSVLPISIFKIKTQNLGL